MDLLDGLSLRGVLDEGAPEEYLIFEPGVEFRVAGEPVKFVGMLTGLLMQDAGIQGRIDRTGFARGCSKDIEPSQAGHGHHFKGLHDKKGFQKIEKTR